MTAALKTALSLEQILRIRVLHMWGQVHYPLDFEMLNNMIPYYQLRLRNRLYYELTFNDYSRVILSMGLKRDLNNKISDISLEYEIITQPDSARHVVMEYQSMVLHGMTEFSSTGKFQ